MSTPFTRHLTALSLLALGGGLLFGMIGHATRGPVIPSVLIAIQPFGTLWVNALQAVVLPLVLTHLLAAVVSWRDDQGESVVRLGGKALLLFVVMLAAAGVFTVLTVPPVLSWYQVDDGLMAQISGVAVPEAARTAAGAASPAEWLTTLLPSNLFRAAAQGDVLSLLIFTVLVGLAITRLPGAQREPIVVVVQGLAAAMLTLVRWVLLLTPLGVFVFGLALALETGGTAAGLLAVFVVLQCAAMLLVTGLLYPLSATLGRVPLRAFARAAAPGQVVAISTRSSVASLPALIQGAREHLGLPAAVTAFVLPFSNSLFKLNRTVSSTVKLLFLAHIFGITLTPMDLVSFVAAIILLSFTAVGVPGGGGAFRTMPVYLAAGVPIAGVVILETVDAIPDIFKTLLNVTGQMSAATLLAGRPAATPVTTTGAVERSPVPEA